MDNGSKKRSNVRKNDRTKKRSEDCQAHRIRCSHRSDYRGLIGGRAVYKYISEALQPVDPESEEVIEVEVPIGSGFESISAILESKESLKMPRFSSIMQNSTMNHSFRQVHMD